VALKQTVQQRIVGPGCGHVQKGIAATVPGVDIEAKVEESQERLRGRPAVCLVN
jgi:hypothetical protein